MKNTERSLAALRDYLKSVDRDELNSIVASIDRLKFEGPTVDEYLNNFEAHYAGLCFSAQDELEIDFEWEIDSSPPTVNPPAHLSPEFSRGFLLISHHESRCPTGCF